MRLVEINEAEAIFEPFWDGGTSEFTNPDKKYRVFSEYTVEYGKSLVGKIEQAWAFTNIIINKANPNEIAIAISRDCDLDITEYDVFKIFASFPETMLFNVFATIDETKVQLAKAVKGYGQSGEYDFIMSGKKITHIRLEFFVADENHSIIGNISWLGLANTARVKYMENRKNYYNSEWKGFFKPDEEIEITPQIGILFGGEDVQVLREKFEIQPFKSAYEKLKEKAYKDILVEPEQFIGKYIAKSDRRWCRDRDVNKPDMNLMMERLAFVGLIEEDLSMLKMACRYAISVAHCEHWCESIIGVFPGATWHHRSFTEEIYCKSCGFVLDWAGSLLTLHGKQVIREAIAMKGLPRLESDFKRVEYIREMNQGIVFSGGKVVGLLSMVARHQRYNSNILETQQDIIEMINNYVQPDGGTLEGPGYWLYTFSNVIPSLYALSRYQKKDFSIFADLLTKTGEFILSMMSQEDDGTTILPINDAHPGLHMLPIVAYSYYKLTGEKIWLNLYQKLLNKGHFSDDIFALIVSPALKGEVEEVSYEPLFFKETGQISVHRQGQDLKTHLHYCSGKAYDAHYHQDKGSFILEADGKIICPDCGAGYYHDANSATLFNANSHNLLLPIFDNGKIPCQDRGNFEGEITKAINDKGFVEISSNETKAWEKGIYESVTRDIISPCAQVFIVVDKAELCEAQRVTFLLNSYENYCKIDKDTFCAEFDDVRLIVKPLNWTTLSDNVRQFQDGEKRDVYQLELEAEKAKEHFLVTAVILEKNNITSITQKENSFNINNKNYNFTVDINGKNVTANSNNGVL